MERDVVFLYHEEGGEGEPREHEDIMFRRVPAAVAGKFRAGAGGRGMTHAQYLTTLVSLHEAMRGAADQGNEAVHAELHRLGLLSVTV